jgi:adenylate kinase family enzyme
MADIVLLSGPPASGKTTVARLLSERYDRVAHVDVNALWRLRSAGLFEPWSADPESGISADRRCVRRLPWLETS